MKREKPCYLNKIKTFFWGSNWAGDRNFDAM